MNDDQARKLINVLERLSDEVHLCHLAITEAPKIAGLATKQDLLDTEQRITSAIATSEEDRQLLQSSLVRAQRIARRITALDSKTARTP